MTVSYENCTLGELYSKQSRHQDLSRLRDEYARRLERLRGKSPIARARDLFRFPFGEGAFEALGDAAMFLLFTFIFAGVNVFIGIAALFCLLVDILYLPLYVLTFPFACLFYALFGKRQIKKLEKKLADVKRQLSLIRIREIEEAIKERLRSLPRKAGVEQTEYYKNKVDEEYRRLMNLPPRDDSLPDRATDPTLDMHPGDY